MAEEMIRGPGHSVTFARGEQMGHQAMRLFAVPDVRCQYAGGRVGSRKMELERRMSPTEPKLARVKL